MNEIKVSIELYIYKTHSEFAKEAPRYVAQALRADKRGSKWVASESLVELHYQLFARVPGLKWEAIEKDLESKGGYRTEMEMNAVDFDTLFQVWVEER